jgi:hypothetical protein
VSKDQPNIGERIASLDARFGAFEKYTHERWHDMANDLQPLIAMPKDLTRDMAKLEARLDARFGDRLTAIEARLTGIEARGNQFTGARMFGVWIIQTVATVAAAIGAVVAMRGHP